MSQIINSTLRVSAAATPALFPNKTANTLTVRGTAAMVEVIDKVIRANDKPRAEVVIDVQILEVNRNRTKELGLNLSNYALGLTFSPEVAPPNTSGTLPPANPPPFNLNTITQGISTADFYLTVPTAVLRFLATDLHTKQIAKPQLRGAEGQEITLNLGEEIPVVSTVFGAAAAGGFASVPQSSFNYRPVGVNIAMTPRVTYEGEIVLDLTIESSTLGPSISVAGQEVPSFSSRKVKTRLRLREGESNLLAGLLRDDQRKQLTGVVGVNNIPVLRSLFGASQDTINQTDIVMLLTPHIVRTHELTADDLAPIYIGTQQNLGLNGPPPLISPVADQPAPAAPAPIGIPGTPPPGAARPPSAAPFGVPTATPNPPPPGTSAVPSFPPPPPAPATPAAPAPATVRRQARLAPGAAGDECSVAGRERSQPGGSTADHCGAGRDPGVAESERTGGGCRREPDGRHPAGGSDAGHHQRSGRDAHGERAIHGAAVGEQRVAALEHDDHRDVQPGCPAREKRAGRHVHAAGRRHGDLHAADRPDRRTGRHRHQPRGRPVRCIRDGAPCSAALRRRGHGERTHPGERRGKYTGGLAGDAAVHPGIGDGEVR